jgi:hypothetical protein
MKRIRLWFLKVFFPKKYYEAVGKDAAKRIADACERATIAMNAFAKAMNNYTVPSGERNQKNDKT